MGLTLWIIWVFISDFLYSMLGFLVENVAKVHVRRKYWQKSLGLSVNFSRLLLKISTMTTLYIKVQNSPDSGRMLFCVHEM